ncbi:MAG: acyl transferase, partial [Cytophagales bacterium]
MDFADIIKKDIFTIDESNFVEYALKSFYYQAYNNSIYSSYIRFLKINPAHVSKLEDIPFLPIEFFKTF